MIRLKLSLVGFFVLFISVCSAYAFDNHDFQVWNTNGQETKIGKHSRLMFEEEFRWGDNVSQFYYQHYDVGYAYILNKYFNFGGGFRYIKELKSNKFRDESDPYFVAFTYWELLNFKFSDRVRIEYKYYDYQVNKWRFRNKLDIRAPWKFTRFEIQPLVADEIFFNFNGINLNENRLYAGFGFSIIKNLKGELTYMLRSTKNAGLGTWNETNVLSAKLKLAF